MIRPRHVSTGQRRLGRVCRAVLPALGVALAAPAASAAQEPEDVRGPSGAVEFHLGVTRLAGVAAGSAGAFGLLDLGSWLRIGGGAWTSLRRIDEGPVLAESGLELGMGYGGALAEIQLPRLPLSFRLLVGGGAATLRTFAVGARFDTETFAVVEPTLVARLHVAGPLWIGGAAAYRRVAGADALFLIDSGDLSGGWGSIFVRIGGS